MSIVGEFDQLSYPGFDFSKAGPRSPFDSNVVFNFELMESVCKYTDSGDECME